MSTGEAAIVYRGVERRKSSRGGAELVVVLDPAYRVKYFSTGHNMEAALNRLLMDDATRLRPEIEKLVANLVSELGANVADDSFLTSLDADHVLRLSNLVGREGTFYALMMTRNHNRDYLARAASRYLLTKRQCEVLQLILHGKNVGEIAEALCITENTVQGYVKSLLQKTQSRNRPAMVAKILDWSSSDGAAPKVSDRRRDSVEEHSA